MGANHLGEIDELCRIAEPDYGLITNIGKAHLEGFGGIEGVKIGKSELYRFLKEKHGQVFINGDDEILHDLALDNDKITYGCKKLYDVIGKDISKSETVTTDHAGVSLKFTTRYGDKDWNKIPAINTQIAGSYNFINCLTAAAVGHYFKVEDSLIKEALEEYVPNMNRSQLVKTVSNTILLDAYNANPSSMKAAIENLAGFQNQNKLLLLGGMMELGNESIAEHRAIIELIAKYTWKKVVLVGGDFKNTPHPFIYFETAEEAGKWLKEQQITGSIILVKGSRSMQMEKVLN